MGLDVGVLRRAVVGVVADARLELDLRFTSKVGKDRESDPEQR